MKSPGSARILRQLHLFDTRTRRHRSSRGALADSLREFRWNGRPTDVSRTEARLESGETLAVETYTNEFWTSRQRAAHSLHEISYRACFKPQLPRFFIERLTKPGDRVYDPFMGRGTTLVEAALLGRVPIGCDVNPLSAILVAPRLSPPTIEAVTRRLDAIDLSRPDECPDELLAFYHPETLQKICALRQYLLSRGRACELDRVDDWIRMVAVTRLTGHSPGFFSVYTLPPNQALSIASQHKINAERNQVPPSRDVRALILAKSRSLLAGCGGEDRSALASQASRSMLLTKSSKATPEIPTASIDLVVTSPPFLDVVDYPTDNWLRLWFCGIHPAAVEITSVRRADEWREAMTQVFLELRRVVKPGGRIAFEVGEVRSGRVKLEEQAIPAGAAAGLVPELVVINAQRFTKTANIWGVSNNRKGTNTNRIVLFRNG